jgi:adenylate kinase
VAAASTRAAHDAVRVIFLGPPGAGKGTQAARLATHLGVPRISTGEMLRDAIAKKTKLGSEASPLMEKGHLVPDDLLVKMIAERTSEKDCSLGYVLDGFPRTLPQAKGLEQMPGGDPRGFIVFDFEVPRPVLMERLSGRRWCPKCQATFHVVNDPPRKPGVCDKCGTKLVQRDDDRETVVAERLREYDERTFPLIEYYGARARVVRIDGNRLQDQVFQDLLQAVEVRA